MTNKKIEGYCPSCGGEMWDKHGSKISAEDYRRKKNFDPEHVFVGIVCEYECFAIFELFAGTGYRVYLGPDQGPILPTKEDCFRFLKLQSFL